MLVVRQLQAMFTVVLALAVSCWVIGNLAWLASGVLLPALPWWLAFLVLTIAAERLELTRLLPTPQHAKKLFPLCVAVILAGATLSLFDTLGLQVFAAGLLRGELALPMLLTAISLAVAAIPEALPRVKIPYHPVFYLPLLALHLSLLYRLAGAWQDGFQFRREAGLENALVLLLFIVVMLASVWRGKRQARRTGKA